jgi:hypothetical protein
MSPRTTLPEVGRSSSAAQCSSVLLPDPEGPMTAVKLPLASSMLTWSSAVTAVGPDPYALDTEISWTAGRFRVGLGRLARVGRASAVRDLSMPRR